MRITTLSHRVDGVYCPAGMETRNAVFQNIIHRCVGSRRMERMRLREQEKHGILRRGSRMSW